MSNASRDEVEAAVREVLAGQAWVAVAYLFGSVAQDVAGPLSDVDVGYVSAGARSADAEGRLRRSPSGSARCATVACSSVVTK